MTQSLHMAALVIAVIGLCSTTVRTQNGATDIEATADWKNRPALVQQIGHTGEIRIVAFAPNGNFVLTGSDDNTGILWEVATGLEIRRFKHSETVTAVDFSPDGRSVLTASRDGTTRLWDIASGAEIRIFRHSDPVLDADFSPDGRTILTGTGAVVTTDNPADDAVHLWDTATGKELRSFRHTSYVWSVAFSPDGRTFATTGTGSTTTVRLWDVATGRELWDWKTFGSEVGISLITFSHDWQLIGTYNYRNLCIWNAKTKQQQKCLPPDSFVNDAAFSPDGRLLILGFNDRAKLVDVDTGSTLLTVENKGLGHIRSVAFSPDGRYVFLAGGEGAFLFDIKTNELMTAFKGFSDIVWQVAVSKDSRFVLTGGDEAHLWDIKTGREIQRFDNTGWVCSVAFSPDRRHVLTGGMGAQLWDIETGKEIRRYGSRLLDVRTVAFSPDGKFVLTGSMRSDPSRTAEASQVNEFLTLWNAETGHEVLRMAGHTGGVISATYSPDGRYILTGSEDGTARLWNADTGAEIKTLLTGPMWVHSVAFSFDSHFALTGGEEAILWDLSDISAIKEVRRFEHSNSVFAVAFSPDGRTILTGSGDKAGHLWDSDTGKKIRKFSLHSEFVVSAAFSPDARYILLGGADNTTSLWDARSGKGICRLLSFRDGIWLTTDSEGRFDTNDLERAGGVHWVLPGDLLSTYPVGIFAREYYEPALLSRLIAGEVIAPVPSLANLNRIQPKVNIVKVERQADAPDSVTVTVEVSSVKSQIEGKKLLHESGVKNLRLFRDGQLVGYKSEFDRSLMVKAETGNYVISFTNIKLPRKEGVKKVEFSAYAFNEDGVKSSTDQFSFGIPDNLQPIKGRAYLVNIGISDYESPALQLTFAANDARIIGDALDGTLKQLNKYEEIIHIPLISDNRQADEQRLEVALPTKENLKAVLDMLAGKRVAAERSKAIPQAHLIRQARPDDLVLISFSGHGYARERDYYLLPYDTGKNIKSGTPDTKHRISDIELADWLRDIDAGGLIMILDTCYSGTIVGEGFKPELFSSPGLGQLAYDKGMLVLASTGNQVAFESSELRMSILTYALIREGIEANKADITPSDGAITASEWLGYGVKRVPEISKEIMGHQQQPILFNFVHRKRNDLLIRSAN